MLFGKLPMVKIAYCIHFSTALNVLVIVPVPISIRIFFILEVSCLAAEDVLLDWHLFLSNNAKGD